MKILHHTCFFSIFFLSVPPVIGQIPQNPDWTDEGEQNSQRYGEQVTMKGDYNGDGYQDLAVGAPKTDSGQTNSGRVYLYLGSDTGLTDTPSWTASSDSGDAFFGGDLSYAGDVDNDGYDDLIVGASEMDSGLTDRGAAFLFRGDSTGLEDTASWIAYGEQAYAFFGRSVSNAGDVNGDGFDDVIVGAYEQDSAKSDAGRAYAFHGSSNGLSNTADWVEGVHEANAWFGRSVSNAGDVNGDGYDDVIVGAPKKGYGTDNYGRIYVYHGDSTGLPQNSDFWCTPPVFSDGKFGRVVTSGGDIDGDGYDDIVVGSDAGGTGGGYAGGEAWAFHGSSTGIQYVNPQEWNYDDTDSYLRFADDLINAGDVNGDGYPDLIVGATGYNSDRGKLFLFTGSDTGYVSTPSSTYAGGQIQTWFGTGLGVGDVDADGSPDLAVGANEYDGAYTDGGKAFVFMNACAANAPSISTTPAAPCKGDSVIMDAGSGYKSYAWSTGDSAQTDTVLLSDTAQYQVKTIGDSGCESKAMIPLTVIDPGFNSIDSSYCLSDDPVSLNGDPSGGSFSGPGVNASSFDPNDAGTGSHTLNYSYTDADGCAESADTTITVKECATGILSHQSEASLELYPNPSAGPITIQHPTGQKWTVEVRDLQGRTLDRFSLKGGKDRSNIGMGELAKGLYTIRFLGNGKERSLKLMIR